jgi:hypothetical protein
VALPVALALELSVQLPVRVSEESGVKLSRGLEVEHATSVSTEAVVLSCIAVIRLSGQGLM